MTRTLVRIQFCALLLVCAGAAVPAIRAEQVAGYRRDGSGLYPDCKLPVRLAYPADVRWEAPLPSWGHGSPIVVGDAVFVVVESSLACDWPQLVCLDLKTGKERWSAVLDAAESASAGDPAARQKLEAAWHMVREFARNKYRCNLDVKVRGDAAKKEWEAKGIVFGSGGDRLASGNAEALASTTKALKAHGIAPETWLEHLTRGTSCIGHAYATPVSDGAQVYVATADGLFAAFDLVGNRKWLAHSPGSLGEFCRNGRSPILYKNLLLSDITNRVRAYDTATGKLLWSDDGPVAAKGANTADDVDGGNGGGSHTIVSPGVLTVGGVDILWAAGCCAYRLPDGKRLKVVGWKDEGMQTLVKSDARDVAFFCGMGEHCGWTSKGKGVNPMPPAAVRFALTGDTLKATVLWSGVGGEPYGGNRPWMLYGHGKLYAPGAGALDALTGKTVLGELSGRNKGGKGGACVPASNHLLQTANGYVYGLSKERAKGQGKGEGGGAVLEVCTLDGKPAGSCSIPEPKVSREELELIRTCERQENWPDFAKGYTFTFGPDCVIVRGNARLYCLGKPGPAKP